MYRKVLLAYDGSLEGRLALREGAELARTCGAGVVLLAVVDLSAGILFAEGATAGAVDHQRETYESVLAEGARHLEAIGFAPETRLETGDPGECIERVAREVGADLVVVGHRHQGTLQRWWSGSVAAHLMDHLGCSLLIGRKDVA
ncbi:MAG: universal stress protein [Bauldia sp.]|nr:universal stress protein [Bauldia sp.]